MDEGVKVVQQGSGTVDPYSFGVIVGKLEGIESGIRDLKSKFEEVPTRREIQGIEERLGNLESAPEKSSTKKIAVLAAWFAAITGMGSIGSFIASLWHH